MRSINPVCLIRRGAVLALLAATAADISASNFYQGITPGTLSWPGGIVPYVFTANVSPAEQVVYLDGMNEWSLAANIQFIPRTTQVNYVILDLDYLQGTNTYYGSVPPVMTVDNLSRAQVCHETGHLLGFQHEHVRTDRNSYITVNFANINTGGATNSSGEGSGSVTNLYTIDSNSIAHGAYDFESVMSYGRTLFSIDPATLDVIDPLPAYTYEYYNLIGNFALSVGDMAGAAYLYGPPANTITNVVTNTADVGPGSLRAAMYYANNHPGATVRFSIPNTDPGYSNGTYTIYLTGQLPSLTANGTIIDATTQPGFAGSPIVALDGSRLIPQTEFTIGGIYMYGANCVVRGLALDNFTNSAVNLLYNYSVSNAVEGCYVGLACDGNTAEPNGYEGINIGVGAHGNIIGGTNSSLRNVISGNAGYAITITGTNTDSNVVLGNYIGLNAVGTAAVSNTYNGIGVWAGSSSNVIGGSSAGAGNVISGNVDYGIYISDSNTVGTVVQGNFIGVNAGVTAAISNSGSGLCLLGGTSGNLIADNVLSGNASYGLFISDPGTSANSIQGNLIGTDARGSNAIPNGYMGIGIWSGATANIIGGTTAAARNIISGNANNGIGMGGAGAGGNVIEGNYVGVAGNGVTALPNVGNGIYIEQSVQTNLIQSNVVSGNIYDGIELYQASNNVLKGNYIGTSASGLGACPNQGYGLALFVSSAGNYLSGNVVAANLAYGVFLSNPGTSSNLLQDNFIGVGPDGATALGNAWQGLILADSASNNVIGLSLGGSGAGNIIADNGYEGIIVYDPGTVGNTIRGNSIFNNGALGINLVGGTENGYGVTDNHPGGAVSGPNDLQNYPVLTAAAVYSNSMLVSGTINSGASRNILIDVYRNISPDPSGYGEGQFYAGSATAQTDINGNGSFSLPLATMLAGQYFTATATDATTGDTSEFARDIESTNASGTGPGDFSVFSYSSSNGFSFDLNLVTNQYYSIEVATNLAANPIHWLDVTDFLATNPLVKITDVAATNSHARYYRAVSP